MLKSAIIFIAVLAGLLLEIAVPVQANDQLEYQVMAAMLLNFTKYVEWPTESATGNNQLTICIAGNSPFNSNIDKYHNKISKGKTVKIRSISGPQEVQGCNVLYIDQSVQSDFAAYLHQTARMPILTASNISQFATNHGIIGFCRLDDRIHFEINLEEARMSRLTFSSNLLKLAKIVH